MYPHQSTKGNFTIRKDESSSYLKMNSTLWWPLGFQLPTEAQWHRAFQILLKNLQSSPKLIKTASHQMAYNTDSLLLRKYLAPSILQ